MSKYVDRLTTIAECEQFAENQSKKDPPLANEARRKSFRLRALKYGATTEAEVEAVVAVYAYEAVLAKRHGRRQSASRTWPMLKAHGIIGGMERVVMREDESSGYKALAEIGLGDLLFEAVIVRHPAQFDAAVVEHCRKRMETLARD